MPTSTFTIAASADDQAVYQFGASNVWPPTEGFARATSDNPLSCSHVWSSTTMYLTIMLMRWDTSSLPDDAACSAGTLRMYITNAVPNDNKKFCGEWRSWDGVSLSDWTAQPTNNAFSEVNVASLSIGSYVDFPLKNLSFVNPTGYTTMRCGLTPLNPMPSGPTEGNGTSVSIAPIENVGGFTPPQLILTYSTFTGRASADAIVASSSFSGSLSDVTADDANWLIGG